MKALEGELGKDNDPGPGGCGLIDCRQSPTDVLGFVGSRVLLDQADLHTEDRNSIAFGGDHNPVRGPLRA